MIQATSLNCSPIKPPKHNFGKKDTNQNKQSVNKTYIDYKAATELLDALDFENFDENTAKAIGGLAEAIKVKNPEKIKNKDGQEVEYVPPLKQMMTTLSLAALGGIVTKGFYNKLLVFIEKNTGVIDWAGKESSKLFSKVAEKINPTEEKTFHGFINRTASSAINWCKEYAQKGVDSIDIEKAVEVAQKSAKGKAIDVKAVEIQTYAKNGIKKMTGTVAGIFSAGTVVGQRTQNKDENGNNIPDAYEKKIADHKDTIQKTQVLEAVLEAAS